MGIPPSQPGNPTREAMYAELAANLDDGPCSWAARYLPVNLPGGVGPATVRVHLSVGRPGRGSAGRAAGRLSGRGAGGPVSDVMDQRVGMLVVVAVAPDEDLDGQTGTGVAGGVVELAELDRFVVPAEAVGRADEGGGGVEVVVGRVVRREGPVWSGEVTW